MVKKIATLPSPIARPTEETGYFPFKISTISLAQQYVHKPHQYFNSL